MPPPTHRTRAGCVAVVAAGLLAACAGTPRQPDATADAALDCAGLDDAIERTQVDRRAAVQRRDEAWKAVLPLAVAGRHARGRTDEARADARLAELQDESARRGCRQRAS